VRNCKSEFHLIITESGWNFNCPFTISKPGEALCERVKILVVTFPAGVPVGDSITSWLQEKNKKNTALNDSNKNFFLCIRLRFFRLINYFIEISANILYCNWEMQ
jgi:hypothetical protein